jgi:hypothetical protein
MLQCLNQLQQVQREVFITTTESNKGCIKTGCLLVSQTNTLLNSEIPFPYI